MILPATEEEKKDFIADMKACGYDFSISIAKVYKRYMPDPYTRIRYVYNNTEGAGIIDKYEGKMVHMAFGIENRTLKIDFEMSAGEVEFYNAKKKDLKLMDEILTKCNYVWDYNSRSLTHVQKRLEIGKTYWYVTDKFSVVNSTE